MQLSPTSSGLGPYDKLMGLLAVALVAIPATSHAGFPAASELRLIKFRDYQQTSNAAPSASSETGMFVVLITEDTTQFDAWNITVNGSPPAGGGFDSGYEGVAGVDNFLEYFDDYNAVDAATMEANYPNDAQYCFNISGGTAGPLQQCESGLGPENWGNIPYLTGNKFTDLSTLDVTKDFTITIPSPAASVSHVGIEINTDEEDEITVFRHDDPPPTFDTSIVVPAGTLAQGVAYELFIEFANANPMASGPISPTGGAKAHNSATSAFFTPTGPPASEYRLIKFRDYDQTSNAQPTTPSFAGFFALLNLSDPNQLGAWSLTVDGSPPADGGFDFGYEGEIGVDTELDYFDDYVGSEQAAVDTNYPSAGTEYCFDISGGDADSLQQCETGLGPESYSVVPWLTGTQYAELPNMDVTSPHTFTINQPSASVTAVQFEIFLDDEDETTVFSQSQSAGQGPFDLTIDMPADTLQEDVAYVAFIEFATAVAGGTGPISPNDTNSKGHNVATNIPFTVPEPSAALCQLTSLMAILALRRCGRSRGGVTGVSGVDGSGRIRAAPARPPCARAAAPPG